MIAVVLDVCSAVLLLTGACFSLVGAIGLLRFTDPPSRLHASSKPQTLGLLLILVGVALQVPARYAFALLLVAALQTVTAPVVGQMVGRTAYLTGRVNRDTMVTDEFPDAGEAPPGPAPGRSGDR
ncbi:monovalent cation/H(+) antiporter subunit G [Saccharothrix isguenensis]